MFVPANFILPWPPIIYVFFALQKKLGGLAK